MFPMKLNIDKIRKDFFKKSISVGHHNIKYTLTQIMLVILNLIKCLETIESGAKSPSAQTIRDRLDLTGAWLLSFHESMWEIAKWAIKRFNRIKWFISIDETYVAFFGDRDKLNAALMKKGVGKFVFGYKNKVKGATGSFCYLVVSLCCNKIRIPIAIKIMKVGERYEPWLKPILKKLLLLVPNAIILADRGFGKSAWFYRLMEELKAQYVVRIPLRKKESKNKVKNGNRHFQQWIKDTITKEKTLLDIFVAKDNKNRRYFLASNITHKSPKQLLLFYMHRWDLENIFKDADRVELPTSSRNPMMRLFCVVTSFLVFTLWQCEKTINRICFSLRIFVKHIVNALCATLNVFISPIGELLKAVT